MTDLAHRREANRSAMPNLDELEALVGPLPETNWYDDCAAHGGEVETEPVFEAADAMRDELIAVIERQAKMLRLAHDDLTLGKWSLLGDWLTDLARRAEEAADD